MQKQEPLVSGVFPGKATGCRRRATARGLHDDGIQLQSRYISALLHLLDTKFRDKICLAMFRPPQAIRNKRKMRLSHWLQYAVITTHTFKDVMSFKDYALSMNNTT